MKKQFKKLFVQPIQDGAKRRRYVRLQLEGLEERDVPAPLPTLEWVPQGNILASNGQNWINTANGQRGTSPLSPCNVLFDSSLSTSPITWDTGGNKSVNYSITKFTLQGSYTSQQEISKGVFINTGAVSSPKFCLLNLYFDGPQADPNNGSYFYVGTGANTISDLKLTGSPANTPSGNFIISPGASLTLGDGFDLNEPMSNTVFDVQGSLTLAPSATDNYSPLYLSNGSWLRAENYSGGAGGTITMNDQSFKTSFITSDGSATNTLFVDPQSFLTVNCNANPDYIQAPILNFGKFTLQGNGSGTTLIVQGQLSSTFGPAYSVDTLAINSGSEPTTSPSPDISGGSSASFLLWDKVQLTCTQGYYQEGANSTYIATMQADTSGDAISALNNTIDIDVYSWVIFATSPQTYGKLTFYGTVIFNGTEQPEVQAGIPTQCDSISVRGNITFGATAYILPIVNGSGWYNTYWQVFTCSGTWTGWSNVQVPSGWYTGNPGYIYY